MSNASSLNASICVYDGRLNEHTVGHMNVHFCDVDLMCTNYGGFHVHA